MLLAAAFRTPAQFGPLAQLLLGVIPSASLAPHRPGLAKVCHHVVGDSELIHIGIINLGLSLYKPGSASSDNVGLGRRAPVGRVVARMACDLARPPCSGQWMYHAARGNAWKRIPEQICVFAQLWVQFARRQNVSGRSRLGITCDNACYQQLSSKRIVGLNLAGEEAGQHLSFGSSRSQSLRRTNAGAGGAVQGRCCTRTDRNASGELHARNSHVLRPRTAGHY